MFARITENTCGTTWPNLRRALDRIAISTFTGPADTFRQRTEITKPKRDILAQLAIDLPADLPAHRIKPLTSTNTAA